MYNVLTVKEVRGAEELAMARGMDAVYLTMSAALSIADKVVEMFPDRGAKIAVFCGPGGNGGDGLLAAIRLLKLGYAVTAYTVGTGSGAVYEKIAGYAKCENLTLLPASDYLSGGADVIVDAIYGIGLNKPIEGDTRELINKLNSERAFKLAVDIPSGINGDSGEVMGAAFKADLTVSFSCYKRGMLFGKGRDHCGKIVIADIGIAASSELCVYTDDDFAPVKRKASAHKGTFGKVFVIGGCATMIGAPLLAGAAAHAAYLNGAGTVTVCVPEIHRTSLGSRSAMSMMRFLPESNDGFIKFDKAALDSIISTATAIDIGMGMGSAPDARAIIEYLNENFDGALIIDADGLNAMKGDYRFLKGGKAKKALTPHVGEFVRLTGKDATAENAKALAVDTGAIVVLKSATTIVTDGQKTVLNVSGTPAMAKGGTGDVLGGCITALACSYELFDAAVIACYRNGVGAERAVSSYSEMMLTPRDILKFADYKETDD